MKSVCYMVEEENIRILWVQPRAFAGFLVLGKIVICVYYNDYSIYYILARERCVSCLLTGQTASGGHANGIIRKISGQP